MDAISNGPNGSRSAVSDSTQCILGQCNWVALRERVLGNTTVDTAGATHRMWDSEGWLWVPLLETCTILNLGLHLTAARALPGASISWLRLTRGPESTDTKQFTHFQTIRTLGSFQSG